MSGFSIRSLIGWKLIFRWTMGSNCLIFGRFLRFFFIHFSLFSVSVHLFNLLTSFECLWCLLKTSQTLLAPCIFNLTMNVTFKFPPFHQCVNKTFPKRQTSFLFLFINPKLRHYQAENEKQHIKEDTQKQSWTDRCPVSHIKQFISIFNVNNHKQKIHK